MGWFNRHLNLTFTFAVIIGNVLVYYWRKLTPISGDLDGSFGLFVLGAVLILGTEIWHIRQKKSSFYNLF